MNCTKPSSPYIIAMVLLFVLAMFKVPQLGKQGFETDEYLSSKIESVNALEQIEYISQLNQD